MIMRNVREETLVFISGMFAGGWIWKETYPNIQNANHWVVDEPLCSIGSDINTISQSLMEGISKIDGPVTLVGNSLGGLIGLDIAVKRPKKIRRVIISGSAGFQDVNLGFELSRKNPRKMANILIGLVCYDKSKISKEIVDVTETTFRDNFRSIFRLFRTGNVQIAEDLLSKIECPVNAIWGKNDIVTPLSEVESSLKKFNISSSVIDNCGHSPMYEEPVKFAAIVEEIIA